MKEAMMNEPVMTGANAEKSRKSKESDAEYSVYIYHRDENKSAPMRWEKRHSTSHVDQAIKRAKILHQSNRYARVEVKKKSICRFRRHTVDQTYRVFCTREMPMQRRLIAISALAIIMLMTGAFYYLVF